MIGAYALDIAREAERDYYFEHKFGANFGIVSGSQSIWTQGGLYPWSAFDAGAQTLYLISTENDTGNVQVFGLDENYVLQNETVTLTGTTAVATTKQFLRVYRMIWKSPSQNVGNITARTVSGAGTVVAKMDAGLGQTLMCVYTVPANTTAFGTQLTVGLGKGGDGRFDVLVRPYEGAFNIRASLEIYQTTFTQTYTVPVRIPAKSDIDFRCITSGNNFQATSSFDLVLDPR